MLKYHNLFLGIQEGLSQILFNHKSPAKVVSNLFNNHKKWGKKDRAFVAETIYDIVRWKAKIEAAQDQEIKPENLAKSIGVWFVLNNYSLPNFDEFKTINQEEILTQFDQNKDKPEVKYSISNWLYEYGKIQLGEEVWHNELEELNQSAKTVLRCNSQKNSRHDLQKQLLEENIETEILENYPEALSLTTKKNVVNAFAYKNGYFQIQDASSQLVAPFLEPKSGMFVIDACAGAGGKSLHLSNLMENKGKILSLDIYPYKLAELENRRKIFGDKIIETKLISANENLSNLYQTADRVLIDAPCSSTGIIRRNPAIKWNLTQDKLNGILTQQQVILNQYSKFVKSGGGLMVYSTCSILPAENQHQIETFLKNHPDFNLVKQHILLPSKSGFDGFYMALVKKN